MTARNEHLADRHNEDLTSSGRHAARGMAWVSIALVFAQALSLLSQIVLGSILPVEAYAVFGLAASALALVAGFQNPAVSKILIHDYSRFQDLVPQYSAFAFQFGLIGMVVLLVIGFAFEAIYPAQLQLFWVIALSSLIIPIAPLNTIRVASLSTQYRFREINVNDMQRSLFYYAILILVALAGAGVYSIALAMLAGTIVQYFLLRRRTLDLDIRFQLPPREFAAILRKHWIVIATAFLVVLSMRSDQLALGRLIDPRTLGFYTFGFLIVTSVTIPVSAGINQVFLPVFARLKSAPNLLRRETIRLSGAVVMLGAAICVVLVGTSASLTHVLWGGKWDGAQVVITVLSLAMPFRFLATIAAAGLEARGLWNQRAALLGFETVFLLFAAAIGAHFGGLFGAIVGAAIQRLVSGLMGFGVLAHQIQLSSSEVLGRALRLYLPFVLSVVLLFLFDPVRHGHDDGFWALIRAFGETAVALALYLLLALGLNRDLAGTVARVIQARMKTATP